MKKLMLSTALVAATSLPAFAQNADEMFRQEANAQEIHASEFIGMRVYRSDEADAEEYEGVQEGWDDIGEINDVVFSREGEVEAVLVDIGGFLGIGENQVAVDMDSIRFVSDSATADEDGDFFIVLNAPRGALEEAPTYGAAAGGDAAMSDEATESADAGEMTETDSESAEGTLVTTNEGAEDTDMAADDTDMAAEETDMAAEDTDMAAAPDATTGDTGTAPAVGETDTQMTEGTGMAREGYTTAAHDELTVDDLTGATAYDANDESVGDVADLLLSEDGKIEAAIVDVGGFLGIGAKSVALELSKLDILRSEDGSDVRVYVSMTEEELEALPEYEN